MYIVFEWIVGTGKSTQSKKLVQYLQTAYPHKEIVHVREPWGTSIAEAIRTLAQGTEFAEEMNPICEAYLYAAARAQLLYTVVKPALDRGAVVIADRSVVSSLAYQGYARDVGVDKVWDINRQAIISCLPSIIFYLEGDIEHALARTFDAHGDKFEKMGLAFFQKVAEGYQKVSGIHIFAHARQKIDAKGSVDDVFARIVEKLVIA
jgi:dTMP kinase